MILINLLPHREEARKRRKQAFVTAMGIAALVGVAVSFLIYLGYQARLSEQQSKNNFIQTEVSKLDNQIQEVATLQTEITSLRARQQAVESLQADRNLPVYLLNEIAKQMPEGVFLTSMKQDNATLTLAGTAQSQERVSELLRNLSNSSQWLSRPELVEIVAGTVNLAPKDQRRVSNFSLRVQLRRADSAETPADRNRPSSLESKKV